MINANDAKPVLDELVRLGVLKQDDADAYLASLDGGGGTTPPDRGMRVRRPVMRQNPPQVLDEIDRRMGGMALNSKPTVSRDQRGRLQISSLRPMRVQEEQPAPQRFRRDPHTGRLHIG